MFDGVRFDEAFRADLLVEGKVTIELKSVEASAPVHQKQLVTYFKLSGLKLSYLLNVGVPTMKEGIQSMINGAIA